MTKLNWALESFGDDPDGPVLGMQLVPLNDLREHQRDPECWCNPIRDEEADEHLAWGLWAHNAMDGREAIEEGSLKPS